MKLNHVIWDWNGTLFDDVQVCIEAENTLLEKYGLMPIESVEAYRRLFCFPVIDYYKKLGFDFTKYDFTAVADEYVALYEAACKKCGLQRGAVQVLDALKAMGVKQYILSASSRESLQKQMEPFRLEGYFEAVLGIEDNLARSKVHLAQKITAGINPHEILMVGDTAHDYEVARELGCRCALIPNGHHGRETLEKTGAVLLSGLPELPDLVKKGL